MRLHLEGMDQSIEGIYIGTWAGHYVLKAAALLEGPERTRDLDGIVRIPRSRVLFAQETKP